MSWGFNVHRSLPKHPNCELGLFWDEAAKKCRKRILQIRIANIPEMLPEKPILPLESHGQSTADFANAMSGLFFTLVYVAAIVFVVRLYFRYLCCWRSNLWGRNANCREQFNGGDLLRPRRGFFADASR